MKLYWLFTFVLVILFQTEKHDLRVTVKGINSSKGLIEFALYKNPDVFTQAGKTHRLARVNAQKGEVSFVFSDLDPGKYAIVVYHDENQNKICDKNFFGIPTEAYAFSNNVRPKLSVPSFEDCAVQLQQNKSIAIQMVY
ncbi:MAG: DUF2141 domain-containing protein [Flavobacteriales bacterium]